MAEKIERDPALLGIPLENIDHWIANGTDAVHRLEQWRGLIQEAQKSPAGFAALLELMRDDSEEARHLKSYSPFAGVLTTKERQTLINGTCAFRH